MTIFYCSEHLKIKDSKACRSYLNLVTYKERNVIIILINNLNRV